MLFGEPELFKRARAAKLGNSALSGTLEEFRTWVSTRFSINVLDVVYDTIDLGPHEGRPRLNLIVETTDDYETIHKDLFSLKPNIKRSMLAGFARIVKASSEPEQYETKDVHLVTDDFSQRAMELAVEQFLRNDSNGVKKRFRGASIWDISGFGGRIVVFYQKDSDIEQNQQSGQSDEIHRVCFKGTKKYDEFDYLYADNFQLEFDSKENVDKKYKGNMFYYWR